jgi:hypothetical protein
MQLIPVERWTFWAAILVLLAGFVGGAVNGVSFSPASGQSTDPTYAFFMGAFVLFIFSVILGGSARSAEENPAFDAEV